MVKINSFNRPETNPYARQIQHNKGQQPRREKAEADQIEISTAAKQLQQSSRVEMERKARVEQLKNQIQNGEYKIDPKSIAKSMAKFYSNQ